jgi:hypothetical protein
MIAAKNILQRGEYGEKKSYSGKRGNVSTGPASALYLLRRRRRNQRPLKQCQSSLHGVRHAKLC